MTLLSRYWIRHFTKSLWWALLPLISFCLLYPNAIAQRHPVQPCLMHCQDGASLIPAQPDQPSAYLETKSAHPLDRTSGKDGPLLSLNASSYGFSLALLQCAAFIPLPDLLPGFPKSGVCFPWPSRRLPSPSLCSLTHSAVLALRPIGRTKPCVIRIICAPGPLFPPSN